MSDKPFPMPGTAWRWLGDPRFDPRPSGPHIVASLRWFRDRTEVVFAHGESCAGVEHLMQSDAWEYVPQVHDLTPSEVTLAKILALLIEYDSSSPSDRTSRTGRVLGNFMFEAFTDTNRALLDRARRARVLRG